MLVTKDPYKTCRRILAQRGIEKREVFCSIETHYGYRTQYVRQLVEFPAGDIEFCRIIGEVNGEAVVITVFFDSGHVLIQAGRAERYIRNVISPEVKEI